MKLWVTFSGLFFFITCNALPAEEFLRDQGFATFPESTGRKAREFAKPRRVFRVPEPRAPLKTLNYEPDERLPRATASFAAKIAPYFAYGKIIINFWYNDGPLPNGARRIKINEQLQLVWRGVANSELTIDAEDNLRFASDKINPYFELQPFEGQRFPERADKDIDALWNFHQHWALEPAQLQNLSTFEGKDVHFALFLDGKLIEDPALNESLSRAFETVLVGEAPAVFTGDSIGRLTSNGWSVTARAYFLERDEPIEFRDQQFFARGVRSAVKETLYVRRTLRKIEDWQKGWTKYLTWWRDDAMSRLVNERRQKIVELRERELRTLPKIRSLVVRSEASTKLDSQYQSLKSKLDVAAAELEEEYLRRLQFFTSETARETREFHRMTSINFTAVAPLIGTEQAKWKPFEDKMALNLGVFDTERGKFKSAQTLTAEREKNFPLPFKLPASCIGYKMQLEIDNSISVIWEENGRATIPLKGPVGIRSLACRGNSLAIILELVKELPEENYRPRNESKLKWTEIGKRHSAGLMLVLEKNIVTYSAKGDRANPFFRVDASKTEPVFEVRSKKGMSDDIDDEFVLTVTPDGATEDQLPYFEPEISETDLSELIDASSFSATAISPPGENK